MKILLADDQELVRETIASFMRMEPGIEVDVAADFPSALARAEQGHKYDPVSYTHLTLPTILRV